MGSSIPETRCLLRTRCPLLFNLYRGTQWLYNIAVLSVIVVLFRLCVQFTQRLEYHLSDVDVIMIYLSDNIQPCVKLVAFVYEMC